MNTRGSFDTTDIQQSTPPPCPTARALASRAAALRTRLRVPSGIDCNQVLGRRDRAPRFEQLDQEIVLILRYLLWLSNRGYGGYASLHGFPCEFVASRTLSALTKARFVEQRRINHSGERHLEVCRITAIGVDAAEQLGGELNFRKASRANLRMPNS